MKEFNFRLINTKNMYSSLIKITMTDKDYLVMLDDDSLLTKFVENIDNPKSMIRFCHIDKYIYEQKKLHEELLKNIEYKEEIYNLKKQLSEAILFD